MCNFQKKTIFQCYVNTEERVAKHATHGFGEFIRGCCSLYEICQEQNWDLKVDFSSHPFATFFRCSVPRRELPLSDIYHSFTKNQVIAHVNASAEMHVNLFTNLISDKNQQPSLECRSFVIEECLTPVSEFQETLNQRFLALKVERKQYRVLHIRAGDISLADGSYSPFFYQLVAIAADKIKLEQPQIPIVVVSDCAPLRDRIANEFKFISTSGKTIHFGQPNLNQASVADTVFDFFLLAHAFKVSSISIYRWPSTFAKQVCQLYGTEFECIDAHHRINFSYGFDEQMRVDCFLQSQRLLFEKEQVLIKRKENFNHLFGDVAPNREKTLRITFEDDDFMMTLPEGRLRGYRITQTDI